MAITLPYRFDTTVLGKVLFKCAIVLVVILTPGVIKFLVLKNWAALAGLLGMCFFVLYLALIIFKKAGGSSGTITSQEITVTPNMFLGLCSNEPQGRFLLTCFNAIRVEWVSRVGNARVSSGINESIYLQAKPGTPDILIARLMDGYGKSLAESLGALLKLPVEIKTGPGQINLHFKPGNKDSDSSTYPEQYNRQHRAE